MVKAGGWAPPSVAVQSGAATSGTVSGGGFAARGGHLVGALSKLGPMGLGLGRHVGGPEVLVL